MVFIFEKHIFRWPKEVFLMVSGAFSGEYDGVCTSSQPQKRAEVRMVHPALSSFLLQRLGCCLFRCCKTWFAFPVFFLIWISRGLQILKKNANLGKTQTFGFEVQFFLAISAVWTHAALYTQTPAKTVKTPAVACREVREPAPAHFSGWFGGWRWA